MRASRRQGQQQRGETFAQVGDRASNKEAKHSRKYVWGTTRSRSVTAVFVALQAHPWKPRSFDPSRGPAAKVNTCQEVLIGVLPEADLLRQCLGYHKEPICYGSVCGTTSSALEAKIF